MSDGRPLVHQYVEYAVTRPEHEDLKERVRIVESKLDRITWLVIATLAASLVDLLVKVRP